MDEWKCLQARFITGTGSIVFNGGVYDFISVKYDSRDTKLVTFNITTEYGLVTVMSPSTMFWWVNCD